MQGFPGELRLKNAAEFDFVFKKPVRSGGRFFTVLARQNGRDHARIGLIISKRCAKAAVKRNRLKRLIRETFRLTQTSLSGLDIVVIGKTPAALEESHKLIITLNRHWMELERCKGS